MRRLALPAVCDLALTAGLAEHASAATTCRLPAHEQEHMGPPYVTSLNVSGGVTCARGTATVRSYCGIPVQFDATVTCASGRRRVVHTYTQNT